MLILPYSINVSEQMKIPEVIPFILSADIIYKIENIVALLMPNNNAAFETVKYSRSLRIDKSVELGLLNVCLLLLFILNFLCFSLYALDAYFKEQYFVFVVLAIKVLLQNRHNLSISILLLISIIIGDNLSLY